MEFLFSKLIIQFIHPLTFFVCLIILSGLITIRKRKVGLFFVFLSTTLLWLTSTPLLSSYLVASLERQYLPVPVIESPAADAIIILGGAVGSADFPRIEVDLTGRSDRVLHAARLYQAQKAPIIIATGGSIKWMSGKNPEAIAIRRLLEELGVPANDILNEVESLNTYQNAINTKKLLTNHGLKDILLVTSASHMPRALATFRTMGINAIPSPTDYTVIDREKLSIFDFLPDAEALAGTTQAIKEYLGLIVYRWRGWIK